MTSSGWGCRIAVDHVLTLEERAADLGAVMDVAGFESASISAVYDACLAALVFAAQHPERVDGLVLLARFAQGWLSAPFEELVGWKDAEQVAAYERVWEHNVETWGRGDSRRMVMPALATPRNLRVWGMLERAFAGPAMLRTQARDCERCRCPRCPAIGAGARVGAASRRQHAPAAVVRHVAELVPHARNQELPGTDNMGEFFASWQRQIEQFVFGATRDVNPDRALMTVLFTDIVGSTEQAALLGDARWREVLVAHERMSRRESRPLVGGL